MSATIDPLAASMWRYRARLALPAGVVPVSLGEGSTALIPAAPRGTFGGAEVWWKDETRNPSGSHKDRALSAAISVAASQGVRTVFVASAGSTGLAAAAYAARAGLRCVVLVGTDASERRLLPLRLAGAAVVRAGGDVDAALDLLGSLARTHGLVDVSTRRSGNPWQAEGPKTIAYELVDQLGRAPDVVIVPIGGGGTIAAIHHGFDDLVTDGVIPRLPRLIGTQPAGYETLVVALRDGLASDAELRAAAFTERPPTVQVKTAHTFAPDGAEALAAVRASGGTVLAISDADALAGCLDLSRRDGIWAEPSSGVVIPALERLVVDGTISAGEVVVALVCGNGFRELDALDVSLAPSLPPIETLPADATARLLELAAG
jgi:threonine synthase